eukprot:11336579-Alexandrium_andersonii.AAC.1
MAPCSAKWSACQMEPPCPWRGMQRTEPSAMESSVARATILSVTSRNCATRGPPASAWRASWES